MTEKQEEVIRNALSVDKGSVHFVTSDWDVAYIAHGNKILVQFNTGDSGRRQFEKKTRGTVRSWITPDKVIAEIDSFAKAHGFYTVCWHKQWGDMKCNRIV